MQIHLSREGEERKGPLSIEEINADLAAFKYSDEDYWAWYEGLEAWIPLHSVPGIHAPARDNAQLPQPKPETKADYNIATEFVESPALQEKQHSSAAPAQAAETSSTAQSSEAPGAWPQSKLFSGAPAKALDHVFLFTSGDGPSLRQSLVKEMILVQIIGANLDEMRGRVERDVFGKCDIGSRIRVEGSVPASAWQAMSSLRPELTKRAKDNEYRVCVRTFVTEDQKDVAAFLFYNKARF